MWLLPRLRLALARRPWLYWLVVAVCGAILWLQWSRVHDAAEGARRSWGATRAVAVSVDSGHPGEPLHIELRDYPDAVVPRDALTQVPAGALAARPVSAGAMLVPQDLVGADSVPADWVVLAVPAHEAPRFVAGQHAAAFAAGARACDGIVAGTSADHVEVAVPSECAASLTDLLLAGSVVLARLP